MKHTRWILFSGLAVVLLGGAAGVLIWVNRPMGKSLALETPTPGISIATAGSIPTLTTSPEEIASTVVVPTSAESPSGSGEGADKICGNTGLMRLLVIGLTMPTDEELLGADAIRLVTLNFNQPSAAIMTLPSLLWVDTPILADLGVEEIQLSVVYYKAYEAAAGLPEKERNQKATEAMAQTIVDNFGYVPDHYLTVDETAFIKYVDALGGIEINLESAVDGTAEGYGIYPAGIQLLNGTHALNFTRLFHPGGIKDLDTWGNLERQNMVVKGILQATLKPQNWAKIPGQLLQVRQAIITDLSLSQTLDLACMVGSVGESSRILVVDKAMIEMDELGRMIPRVEAIKQLITEMDGSS